MSLFMWFLLTSSSSSEVVPCNPDICPSLFLQGDYCYLDCNTAACGFDYNLYFTSTVVFNFSSSECYENCISTDTCDMSLLNNTVCDAGCNSAECGWDLGDCGYCAQGCTISLLTNGLCDEVCSGEACSFDNNACGLCALGCFEEDLYSSNCTPACNVTACENVGNNPCYFDCAPGCSREMQLNGYCDQACSNADCWYDEGACLCAADCTPEVMAEEFCRGEEDPCATEGCDYKNGVCGTCALLCFEGMLGNGVCDPECNNYQCSYDYSDCGCAPGCASVYNTSTGWVWDTSGSEECLVPACEYNYGAGFSDPFLVREQILSQIISRNWSFNNLTEHPECSAEELQLYDEGALCNSSSACFTEESMYCMGMFSPRPPDCLRYDGDNCLVCEGVMIMHVCTNMVSECPEGYQSQSEIAQLFDSGNTNNLFCLRSPEVFSPYNYKTYYVGPSSPPLSTGSGTDYDPFNSLYFAFTKVYASFTQIILAPGEYLYQVDYSLVTPLVTDKYNPLHINSFLDFYELWIIGDPYDQAVVYWTEKLMISPRAYSTYIQNIVFLGDYILRNNCTGESDFCYYCPILDFLYGCFYTDEGGMLSLDEYYQIPTNCSDYHDHIVFSFMHPAFFESVTISDFRQQFNSLIFSNASLTLENVYFESLQAKAGGSVITLDCTNDCSDSNFIYTSGSVFYLNSGYQHTDTVQVGNFFTSNSFNSTCFENIYFKLNFVLCCSTCAYQAHLISVSNSLGVTIISNVKFEAIYANSLIILDQRNLVYTDLLPGFLNISHAYSQVHIQISKITILYVYTSTDCINVLMEKTLQNIYINNVVITSSLARSNGFINLESLGPWAQSDIYGGHTLAIVDQVQIPVRIPPRTLQIISFVTNKVYTETYPISIIGMPCIDIEGTNIMYLQDTIRTSLDIVVGRFRKSGMYFSEIINSNISGLNCKGSIYIANAYSITITNINISKSLCKNYQSAGGVIVDTVATNCNIFGATMSDIHQHSTTGIALSLQNIVGILTLDSIQMSIIYNIIGGAVSIDSVGVVNFTNINIEYCSSTFGALITISESANISISDFYFNGFDTSANYGGCLFISAPRTQSSYLSLTNGTIFKVGAPPSLGGGLCIQSTSNQYPTLIIIANVLFDTITATDGAAIYISDTLILTEDSIIENVNITNCVSGFSGILSDYHIRGLLTISNVRMHGNYANENSIFIGSYLTYQFLETRLSVSDLDITGGISLHPAISIRGLSNEYVSVNLTRISVFNVTGSSEKSLADGISIEAVNCSISELSIVSMNQALQIASSASVSICNSAFMLLDGSFAVVSGNSNFDCIDCEVAFIKKSIVEANSFSSVNLINCSIHDNNALLSVLPLVSITDNTQTTSSFVNCSFTDNTAQMADTFHFSNTLVIINSCTISRNYAVTYDYSGIYAFSTNLKIISSEFNHQTSNKLGAFLYALGNSNVMIDSTTFSQGYAANGGALYIDSSNITIYSSTFNQVQANIGGAIYISGSILLINSSTFLENAALASGGSIYASNTQISLINSTFIAGSSLLGADLYIDSTGSIYISNSQFIGSKSNNIAYTASVYILTNASVTVENSAFAFPQNNISGIMVNGASAVNITDCTFQNASSAGYGSLTCFGGLVGGNVTVLRSKFINNYSTGNGAGLYLQDMGLVMTDSIVKGNVAGINGGGMYLISPNCKNCSFSIRGVTNITYNSCALEGGAMKWLDYKPNIDSTVIIKNNTAAYGGDFASVPSGLKAHSGRSLDDSADFIIFGAAPGQNFTRIFNISLYDTYGNVVVTDNTSTITLQTMISYPDLSLRANTTFTALQGVFSISSFIPDGPPGSIQRFIASTSAISDSSVSNDITTYSNSIVIELFLRDCTSGEQISGSMCIPCIAPTYLIDPGYICNNCPDGAICPGSAWILPRPGYWRSSNFSEIVYECPIKNACLGNTSMFDYQGTCSGEYHGIMCNTCKDGYIKATDGTCESCPSEGLRMFEIILICAILLIIGIILVKASIKSAFSPKSMISIYIKILTNYLQLMFLTAQFEFSWPSYVLQFLSSQKFIVTSTDSIFSVDCYVSSKSNSYYYKLTLICVMPLIVFAVSLLVWLGICFTKETWSYLKRELLLTMIIGFFLVYPNISIACFSHFSCLDIDKIGSYLKENYTIQCSGETYTKFYLIVVIPSMIIWIVGLPAMILVIMTKRRRFLNQDQNRVIFGFLFNGYKKATFFWEFLIMYRKVLIISIVTFLANISASFQALSIFLLLNLSVFLHLKLQPYVSEVLNHMETESLITSAVTVYCGLFYLTQDTAGPFQIVLFVMIVVGNAYFILYWGYWMFQALLDIIVKYFPSLKHALKKGDSYDEEFYQEKLSRPGSYYESREGERLYSFMSTSPREKKLPYFKTINMDQLFSNTIEQEYIDGKIAVLNNEKISLDTVIEDTKENEDNHEFTEVKTFIGSKNNEIKQLPNKETEINMQNYPEKKEILEDEYINRLANTPEADQSQLFIKKNSIPNFELESDPKI